MKKLLAIGSLIAIVSAPCGAATEIPEQVIARAVASAGDEADRYAAEATKFARRADAYATAAKQYLATGKPMTADQAKRCAALSDMYRQLAVSVRDLARRARRISAQDGAQNLST
jgi:hypothetical protein